MSHITDRLLDRMGKYLKADHSNDPLLPKYAYFTRFKRLYDLMLEATGAPLEFFQGFNYGAISLDDLEWICDEVNMVPNAENGEMVIEDASREDIWRDIFLKGEGEGVELSLEIIRQMPSAREVETYF